MFNKHKTVKCFINVDKGVKDIVQLLLSKYMYGLIPFACCEDQGNDKAYLSIVVRSEKDLINFIKEVFYGYSYTLDFNDRDYTYTCRISWYTVMNKIFAKAARESIKE